MTYEQTPDDKAYSEFMDGWQKAEDAKVEHKAIWDGLTNFQHEQLALVPCTIQHKGIIWRDLETKGLVDCEPTRDGFDIVLTRKGSAVLAAGQPATEQAEGGKAATTELADDGFVPNKKFSDMTPEELAKWHEDEYLMWNGETIEETMAREDGKPTEITAAEFVEGEYAKLISEGKCVVTWADDVVKTITIDDFEGNTRQHKTAYFENGNNCAAWNIDKFAVTWLSQPANKEAGAGVTWDGLPEKEQIALQTWVNVDRVFVNEIEKSLQDKGLIHIVRIDHHRHQNMYTDLGHSVLKQSTDDEIQSAALDHVASQWTMLHMELSQALGLEFYPEEDIERYTEAIATLQAALEAAQAENARLREAANETLSLWQEVVTQSKGVVGWHLNGAIAEWDEFGDLSEPLATALAATGKPATESEVSDGK